MGAITQLPVATRAQWASRINGAWQKSIEAILETGALIIDARRQLPHGEFMAMVEQDLPFAISTAERLMKVAANPVLADSAHGPNLPASWRTLYELTKLDEPTLIAKMRDGSINPNIDRDDVIAWRKAPKPAPPAPIDVRDAMQPLRKAPAHPGPAIRVPAGMSLSNLTRAGLALERDGMSVEAAAKQIHIGRESYRQARAIVQLADLPDLPADEADIAKRALAAMDENRRTAAAYETVSDLADRVWGHRRRLDDRNARKRVETFKTALMIIVEACTRGRALDVPHLSAEDSRTALEQIGEASIALRGIAAKIRRVEP